MNTLDNIIKLIEKGLYAQSIPNIVGNSNFIEEAKQALNQLKVAEVYSGYIPSSYELNDYIYWRGTNDNFEFLEINNVTNLPCKGDDDPIQIIIMSASG